MELEMNNLRHRNYFEIGIELPHEARPILFRWFYDRKRNNIGQVTKHRAQLDVNGFMKQYGIDYNKLFAPVSKYTTLCVLLEVIVHQNMHSLRLDIKLGISYGDLDEVLYL